jgi:hypothetical protein
MATTTSSKQLTGPKWSQIEYRLLAYWIQNDRAEMKRHDFTLHQVAEEMSKETKWLRSQPDLDLLFPLAHWETRDMRLPTRDYSATKLSTKIRKIVTSADGYVPLSPRNPDRANTSISGKMAENNKGNDLTHTPETPMGASENSKCATDSQSMLDTEKIAGMPNTKMPTHRLLHQISPLAGGAYNSQSRFGQELPALRRQNHEVDLRQDQSLEQPGIFPT